MYTTNRQGGFIALISAMLISSMLLAFALLGGSKGVWARLDALEGEYARIALSLTDSCVELALLRIDQDYFYAGNESMTIGVDAQGRVEECAIGPVTYANGVAHATATQESVFFTASAHYPPLGGAYERVAVSAMVQNPAFTMLAHTTERVHILSWLPLP